MKDNFDTALALVLKHEGGFVNHPKDPGGATNMGITNATLALWRNQPLSVQAVKDLTISEAGEIYRAKYWQTARCMDLPSGVDYAVFDCAVNSGPSRAIKILQTVLGVEADGKIGPKTLQRAWAVDAKALIGRYSIARSDFLAGLSTYKTFGKGWDRRIREVKRDALAMSSLADTTPFAPATRKPEAPGTLAGKLVDVANRIVSVIMLGISK